MDYGRKFLKKFWPLKSNYEQHGTDEDCTDVAVLSTENPKSDLSLPGGKIAKEPNADRRNGQDAAAAAAGQETASSSRCQGEVCPPPAPAAAAAAAASNQSDREEEEEEVEVEKEEEDEEGEKCAICWGEMGAHNPQGGPTTSLVPYCRHRFHSCCIAAWMKVRWSCPMCRRFALLIFEFPPLPNGIRSKLLFG